MDKENQARPIQYFAWASSSTEPRLIPALSPEHAARTYATQLVQVGFAATEGVQTATVHVIRVKEPESVTTWKITLMMTSELVGLDARPHGSEAGVCFSA